MGVAIFQNIIYGHLKLNFTYFFREIVFFFWCFPAIKNVKTTLSSRDINRWWAGFDWQAVVVYDAYTWKSLKCFKKSREIEDRGLGVVNGQSVWVSRLASSSWCSNLNPPTCVGVYVGMECYRAARDVRQVIMFTLRYPREPACDSEVPREGKEAHVLSSPWPARTYTHISQFAG